MEDLSLHILDIAENALSAGAGRVEVRVEEDIGRDLLILTIQDNGEGMDAETVRHATDPFFTTKTVRRVGLGLPLLKQAAEECDGRFSIISEKGRGTMVTASFRYSHIDRKPLGDIAATLVVLIAGNPGADFLFAYRKDGYRYRFDSRRIKQELGEVPITMPKVLEFVRQDISGGIRAGREDDQGQEKHISEGAEEVDS